uniref:Uncharacterized protein n=1 Tax=Araneus ventricosus TaxID=182803 RepID=A0A4Y2TZR3_ARAVE|nr:hypothetical protein AVEN_252627-1 [Araneus ventricosus]
MLQFKIVRTFPTHTIILKEPDKEILFRKRHEALRNRLSLHLPILIYVGRQPSQPICEDIHSKTNILPTACNVHLKRHLQLNQEINQNELSSEWEKTSLTFYKDLIIQSCSSHSYQQWFVFHNIPPALAVVNLNHLPLQRGQRMELYTKLSALAEQSICGLYLTKYSPLRFNNYKVD